MRPPIDEFQIYLLAKMSNARLVSAALQRLGVDEGEKSPIASAFMAASKIEEIGHQARIYAAVLGAPMSERVLGPSDTSTTFVGSWRRTYSLPVWPTVDFVVNEHPDGWAWGERFEQRAAQQVPADLDQIQPWEWTESALLSAAQEHEIVDRWTDFLEAVLKFDRPHGRVAFSARFDMGLLQSWRHV